MSGVLCAVQLPFQCGDLQSISHQGSDSPSGVRRQEAERELLTLTGSRTQQTGKKTRIWKQSASERERGASQHRILKYHSQRLNAPAGCSARPASPSCSVSPQMTLRVPHCSLLFPSPLVTIVLQERFNISHLTMEKNISHW